MFSKLRTSLLQQSKRYVSNIAYPTSKLSVLNNGIRISTETVNTDTVTVAVCVDSGSRYENEKNNGVAHYCEHMFFKGTNKHSRIAWEKQIENLGSTLNAYTSRESTVFYITSNKNDVAQAMDILADMITNSKFDASDIELERQTILREATEVNKSMEEVIFDRLHETAYRGTALGRTILGPNENVMRLTASDLKDYIARHYTGNRMIISAAGPVDHKQIVGLGEKLFSSVPALPKVDQQPYMEPAAFLGSDIRIRFDSEPLAHIALAWPTAGWCDPDHVPLLLIQYLFGRFNSQDTGSMFSSSSLIRHIASNQLATSLSPFNTIYSDTGLFGFYFITNQYSTMETVTSSISHLIELSYNVSDALLEQAKNSLKADLLNQLNSSQLIAEDLGNHYLRYNRRIHINELLYRIDNVDTNSIKATVQRFMVDRDFALAAVGPIYELPDYNILRRSTYKLK